VGSIVIVPMARTVLRGGGLNSHTSKGLLSGQLR